MEQLSMFSGDPLFPQSYDDIKSLFDEYIYEGEKDDDVFSWNDIQNGRSYYFYGQKVFEYRPASMGKPFIKLMDPSSKITDENRLQLMPTLQILKEKKRSIFRNLITESFACCNDYRKCSAAGHCLHPDDRFYNGCAYRSNLESGRNFYREENL